MGIYSWFSSWFHSMDYWFGCLPSCCVFRWALKHGRYWHMVYSRKNTGYRLVAHTKAHVLDCRFKDATGRLTSSRLRTLWMLLLPRGSISAFAISERFLASKPYPAWILRPESSTIGCMYVDTCIHIWEPPVDSPKGLQGLVVSTGACWGRSRGI